MWDWGREKPREREGMAYRDGRQRAADKKGSGADDGENKPDRERARGPWPSHYSRRDDAAERDSHKLFAIKISAEQELFPLLATGISEVIKTRSV